MFFGGNVLILPTRSRGDELGHFVGRGNTTPSSVEEGYSVVVLPEPRGNSHVVFSKNVKAYCQQDAHAHEQKRWHPSSTKCSRC